MNPLKGFQYMEHVQYPTKPKQSAENKIEYKLVHGSVCMSTDPVLIYIF